MREALDRAGDHYDEYLPAGDPRRGGARRRSPRRSRRPTTRRSFEGRDAALRRLAFDELLALQLGMVGRRRQRGRDAARGDRARRRRRRDAAGVVDRLDPGEGRRATSTLTPDQDTAIAAIRDGPRPPDPDAPPPPGRRRQRQDGGRGVGPGRGGARTAARAPCSPRRTCSPGSTTRRWPALLEDAGIPVELLTGSQTAAVASHVRDLVKSGQAPVVVGTHALIQERVEFARPRRRRDRRAAPVRRRAAWPARGEGRRPRPARPADDRDADPADARPGPVRGPRRLRPPDAAGGPDPDPDGDPPAGPARRRPGTGSAQEAAAGHRTFVVVPLIDEAEDDATADGGQADRLRLVGAGGRGRVRPPPRAPRAAPGRDGPRPDEGRRPRRRDGPVPRRRARRDRRHDRRRGRRRRAPRRR